MKKCGFIGEVIALPAAFIRALLLLGALATAAAAQAAADSPGDEVAAAIIKEYIDAWVAFYPSRAFAYGRAASAAEFEDFSPARVEAWLALNRRSGERVRAQLNGAVTVPGGQRTDLRVLLAKTEDELANWREDEPLTRQPQWYAEQVSQALTHLLVRDQLSDRQRSVALQARLRGVARLCRQGQQLLSGGNALRSQRALRTLAAARTYYAGGLGELIESWPLPGDSEPLTRSVEEAIAAITDLEMHIREEVLPGASPSPSLGAAIYDAKLSRRTSGLYRAATLHRDALDEVRLVRGLMVAEAGRWRAALPAAARTSVATLDGEALLAAALAAMEADRQDNSADFLASFSQLTRASERFVEEHGIATIPKPTTLLIALSPAHFSGAAVGGVYPSGPFAPEADTLFYIPSIPDSASPEAREGFYRSFNTHFNTMILSHEMFPGHYLQYKVAVSEASMLRTLFSNGSYTEGWGTFVEKLMLDAGWADTAPLTVLAHLRKRLENATRAYVSVQVNSGGWGEAEVLAFARDEGLLAPQFAINLWQRVVNSPLQITDYFTGGREFLRLYAAYMARPQNAGSRAWVDAVLRAGPIPLALLEAELPQALAGPASQ